MTETKQINWITDIKENFLVEASAGTGKTHNLLQKILNIIEQNPNMKMRELVAITFTEKASAELKLRLRKELTKKVRESSDKSNPFYQALSELEHAQISTIHSFCAHLLRLKPVEAKISPEFTVLDSSKADFLFDMCWEKWLEQLIQNSPEFFSKLKKTSIKPSDLKSLAKGLYDVRDIFIPQAKKFINPPDALDIEEAEKKFKALYERLKSEAPKIETLNRAMKEIDSLINKPEADKERIWYQFKHKDLKPTNSWKTSPAATQINQEMIELFKRVRAKPIGEFINAINDFFNLLEEEKQREALDFQDLLFKAREILTDKETRRYFKNRFKYILVDEFQDTDPVQVEIIFYLAEEIESFATDWTKVKLTPGKLFPVGDPKQSIYHFRRADLSIYDLAKKIIQKSDRNQPVLEQNRRSHPDILNWVNLTFQNRFQQKEGIQPAYQGLKPAPDSALPKLDPKMNKPVIVIELEKMNEYKPEDENYCFDDIRKLEAEAVANFIQSSCGKLKIWDKNINDFRPAKYSDFAVLYPTHESAKPVIKKFREKGIDFQIEASKDFLNHEEISGLISVLTTLANPIDNLALLGALRSIYFSVSDQELFKFRQINGSWDWLNADPEKIKIESISSAYSLLKELYTNRDRKSIYWLIEKLVQNSGIYQLQKLHPNFTQALLNLERIKAIAKNFDADPDRSLSDFISWLKSLSEKESIDWPEMVAQDSSDTVKLMTFHKSKGLEFPIVILIDLIHELPSSSTTIIKDWKNREIAFCLKHYATLNYDQMFESEQEYLNSEQIRKLYVATTRAKNYLVITDYRKIDPNKIDKQNFSIISDGIPLPDDSSHPASKFIIRIPAKNFIPSKTLEKTSELQKLIQLMPAETEIEKEKKIFENDFEQKIKSAQKTPEIKYPSQEEKFEELHFVETTERDNARLIGIIVHRVIELAGKCELSSALKLAERLVKEYQIEDSLKQIQQLLSSFWKSELKKEIQSKKSFQEVQFILPEQEKIWLGKIDLILEQNDCLTLIDLKTDSITKDYLNERNKIYLPQIDIYKKALLNLKNKTLKDSFIFYINPGILSRI